MSVVDRSFWRHRSRILLIFPMPSAFLYLLKSTFCSFVPTLKMPMARLPSLSGLLHICMSPSITSRLACLPSMS